MCTASVSTLQAWENFPYSGLLPAFSHWSCNNRVIAVKCRHQLVSGRWKLWSCILHVAIGGAEIRHRCSRIQSYYRMPLVCIKSNPPRWLSGFDYTHAIVMRRFVDWDQHTYVTFQREKKSDIHFASIKHRHDLLRRTQQIMVSHKNFSHCVPTTMPCVLVWIYYFPFECSLRNNIPYCCRHLLNSFLGVCILQKCNSQSIAT